MIIAGIQKTSLIDYPKKISTVIFTQGCNFRCGFCHNPKLVDPKKYTKTLNESEVFDYLKKRKKIIDAIVITGGEPTIQKDLIIFIAKIKSIGFAIKLDTNGSNPEIINKLFKNNLIDYIAMDIKAPLEKYRHITNSKITLSNIKKSIKLIINSQIPYEFRTTVIPFYVNVDFLKIAKLLNGAKKYYLQNFKNSVTLEKKYSHLLPKTKKEIKKFVPILNKYIQQVIIR